MISWQGVTIFRRQPAKDAGLAVTLTEDNDSDIPDLEDGGILEPLLPRGGDFGDEMKGEGAEEDTRGDGRRGLSEFAVRNLCLEVKRGEVRNVLCEEYISSSIDDIIDYSKPVNNDNNERILDNISKLLVTLV